jgi:hypothetical protein
MWDVSRSTWFILFVTGIIDGFFFINGNAFLCYIVGREFFDLPSDCPAGWLRSNTWAGCFGCCFKL